jgi:Txe/YoeB family toxin of Txe-Axe toxin-antitoxin module
VIDKKITVVFADEDIQKAYFRMKTDNPSLYKFLERATDDLKQNPFCGIQIPKRQIPKTYVSKYEINNLWKYNLPNAWRLVYSVAGSEVEIIAILLEWFPHKEYEKRFNY